MNKEDLVYIVSKKRGISYIDSYKHVDVIFDTLKEFLLNGEKIVLKNFGTFDVVERAARKGHNPHTKEVFDIPACKEPVFRYGKELKVILNSTED